MLYTEKNTHIFSKTRTPNFLPVFYQQNQKVWPIFILLIEWFSPVPLFIIDKATQNLEYVYYENGSFEVLFSPQNIMLVFLSFDRASSI